MPPPLTERDYDWHAIAHACDVDRADLRRAGPVLTPGLDVLRSAPSGSERGTLQRGAERLDVGPRRRGPRAKPIIEFPESDGRPWTDPPSLADAVDLHMRHRGTAKHLARILEVSALQVDATAVRLWRRGLKARAPREVLRCWNSYTYALVEGQRIIDDYFRRTFKSTERIIESDSDAAFFAGLRQIDKIFVMGHSLSNVDHGYFHEVIGNVDADRVRWTFSYFGDLDRVRARVAELGIAPHLVEFAELGDF